MLCSTEYLYIPRILRVLGNVQRRSASATAAKTMFPSRVEGRPEEIMIMIIMIIILLLLIILLLIILLLCISESIVEGDSRMPRSGPQSIFIISIMYIHICQLYVIVNTYIHIVSYWLYIYTYIYIYVNIVYIYIHIVSYWLYIYMSIIHIYI